MFFWDRFVNFCPFDIKKKFWRDLGTEPTFWLHIGRFPANSGRKSKFEISKIWDFCYFWANFGLFFFKCPNVEQNSLKWKIILFFSFRTSQRWNLVLVNIFLAVWSIFIFQFFWSKIRQLRTMCLGLYTYFEYFFKKTEFLYQKFKVDFKGRFLTAHIPCDFLLCWVMKVSFK